jgi:hypothetical protein
MLRPNDVNARMAIMRQINSLSFKNRDNVEIDQLVLQIYQRQKMAIFGNSKTLIKIGKA